MVVRAAVLHDMGCIFSLDMFDLTSTSYQKPGAVDVILLFVCSVESEFAICSFSLACFVFACSLLVIYVLFQELILQRRAR